MHFKNADQWAHTLYRKILNTHTILKDGTPLLQFCARWSCKL